MSTEKRPQVLFVDDEPSIRLTLPPVLEQNGFEVSVAATVTEALFQINSQTFDILISDLNIAEEGDGFLVLSAMRHIQPDCINFILTGYPAFESAVQAIHNQVDDYLVKPVEVEPLVATIHEKLQNRKARPGARGIAPLLKTHLQEIASSAGSCGNETAGRLEKEEIESMLTALIEQLEGGKGQLSSAASRSASAFGSRMKRQKHDAAEIAAAVQHCEDAIHAFLQQHLAAVDLTTLLGDLRQIHAGAGLFLQNCLRGYENSKKPGINAEAAGKG